MLPTRISKKFFDKYDIVKMDSKEDWSKLLDYGFAKLFNNKEDGFYIIDYQPVLKEGIIDYTNFPSNEMYSHVYFKDLIQEKKIEFKIIHNKMIIAEAIFNKVADKLEYLSLMNKIIDLKDDVAIKFNEQFRNLSYHHIVLMQYMENQKNVVINYVDNKKLKKKNKKSNRNKKRKNVVEVGKKVYTVYANDFDNKKDNDNSLTFTKEAWGVRGHWRTYPSGKKVWIKPYVKGKKRNEVDKVEGKVYKIKDK